MDLLQYILISTTCLSISYLAYCLFLRKYTNFHYLRLFLIWSLITSMILPLLSVSIDYTSLFGKEKMTTMLLPANIGSELTDVANPAKEGFISTHSYLFLRFYLAITSLLILRILIQLVRMLSLYLVSDRRRSGKNMVLYSGFIKSPYSFFRWIFIPYNLSDNEEGENIITHESIHASQYHSFDILLIELTTAVMWFNPLVWMMKGSLHLVHEYLADEGALSTGIDRLRYQALLINQVTEERLICLSSSFNHSLIKKRMIMMTKSKNNRQNKLKILTLIPLSAALFLIVALLNGLFPAELQAKSIEPNYVSISEPSPVPDKLIVQDDTTKKKTCTIKVVSNKKSSSDEIKVIGYGDSDLSDSVIFIVDGKHVEKVGVSPDSIVSINIMKDDNLIIIRTTEGSNSHNEKVRIRKDNLDIPANTIVFIDEEKSTKEDIEKLDPEQIESITVLKEGDSEGIIKVTTKAKK